MKEYTGIHAVGDSAAHILIREKGIKSPRVLVKHFSGEWQWGQEDSKEVAKSLLLDAFGITECKYKKCRCESEFVTQAHIDEFTEKIVSKFDENNTFKISQITICDFVFDMNLMYNRIQEELENIKVPEPV